MAVGSNRKILLANDTKPWYISVGGIEMKNYLFQWKSLASRDVVALLAMASLNIGGNVDVDAVPQEAVKQADALIAELNKAQP
jgi:hypothetical protein